MSGQGGWALYDGTKANYTIQSAITANPTGNALAINQTAGTLAANYSRDAKQAFTASSWANRTTGQNTAVFKWDMYVPAGGTSTNTMGAEIENSSYYSLGGIYIRPSDGQVFIRGKVNAGSSSNYSITDSFVTLGAWNSYSVAYNSVSGVSRMSWTDKTAGNVYTDLTLYSAYTPTEIDLNAVTYNIYTTVANTVYYDNVAAYATVPSPGAVALIGLAGLVARRRR